MKLLCFPYAGGSSISYRELGDSIDFIRVATYDLPGRGSRVREKPLQNTEGLVSDLFVHLRDELDGPYAFFGHSLGALLAHSLTRRLAAEQILLPTHIFVSGCSGPSIRTDNGWHLLPKPEFRRMLARLGGCPPEILSDPDLMDFFEPILRADFCAAGTFRYQPSEPFDVPITVMIGSNDKDVSLEMALCWQMETRQTISLHSFEGGHFFILRHWDQIRQLILHRLSHSGPAGSVVGRR
jgi:surfactin synthase thioesterase subunit